MSSNPSTYNPNPYRDQSHEPSFTESLEGTANQVKDRVADLGNRAANSVDESRDAAARGLKSAASALHGTASKLDSTADYVRDHNVSSMMGDVKTLVRNNPGPCMIGAAVLGFVVARACMPSRD